jgi:hypothetical protein
LSEVTKKENQNSKIYGIIRENQLLLKKQPSPILINYPNK